MLIRPPDLPIPAEDPFANDALERAKLEPPLTEFITQATGPFVLAIDGAWGTGKTTFIKMWLPKLEQRGHLCLYFNAWETDFAPDPLVALVGELSKAIQLHLDRGKSASKIRQHLRKTKKLATLVAKRALPAAVKALTAGALDLNEVAEEALGDTASGVAEDAIEEYEEGKSEIKEFRESLGRLVDEVLGLREDQDAKIVIFVDELDRCRPTYTVELLERVKHLFDVPRVVFVLGVDRAQLTHSVCAVYGAGFDAAGYLRRFVDLDYRLPGPPEARYTAHLVEVFEIDRIVLARSYAPQVELRSLVGDLGRWAAGARLGLRALNQVFSRLRVVLQTIPRDHYLFPEALAFLVFLREWSPALFDQLSARTVNPAVLLAKLDEILPTAGGPDEREGCWMEATVLSGLAELGLSTERLGKYTEVAAAEENQGPLQSREATIVAMIRDLTHQARGAARAFGLTLKRLSLVDPFLPPESPGAQQ